MKNRTIVFVAGADFSGTTMLDFIIGSSPVASSLGEVVRLAEPIHLRHMTPMCTCHRACNEWPWHSVDAEEVYSKVFALRDEIVLVDSSKNPVWIADQIASARQSGFDVKGVLIWKDPASYAVSCVARGKRWWYLKWLWYHTCLAGTGLTFKSVPLERLLDDWSHTREELQDWLSIPMPDTAREYSDHEHHAVFGSSTARRRLFTPGTDDYAMEVATSVRDVEFAGPPSVPWIAQRAVEALHRRLLAPLFLPTSLAIPLLAVARCVEARRRARFSELRAND